MAKIAILGMGNDFEKNICLRTYNKLKEAASIFILTEKYNFVNSISIWKIDYKVFDDFFRLYPEEEAENKTVDYLINAAKDEDIVFAVPGLPVSENSVVEKLLLEAKLKEISVEFIFPSYVMDSKSVLSGNKRINSSINIIDAQDEEYNNINIDNDLLIINIKKKKTAELIQEKLKVLLGESYYVEIFDATKDEKWKKILINQMKTEKWDDFSTACVYIPILEAKLYNSIYPLDPLTEVMERLLSPEGCPWDREQDHHSLKRYLLEETYEVLEAIDEEDMNKLCEELGDLLLQVVFHAALASKRNDFTINNVIAEVTEKMVRRHPHVFAGLQISGTGDVLTNWEIIKAKEKGKKKQGLLGTIPRGFPALLHALKIQEKAAKVGFDWPSIDGAWEKLYEELEELKEAEKQGKGIYEELGDLLFAVVNVARFLNINPEEALLATVRKFRDRFSFVESKINETGREFARFSLEELDKWWEEAKKPRNF